MAGQARAAVEFAVPHPGTPRLGPATTPALVIEAAAVGIDEAA
jgi:hypothetical protein